MLEEKIFSILIRNTDYWIQKIILLNINGIVINFAKVIEEAVIKTQSNTTSDISWFLNEKKWKKRNSL